MRISNRCISVLRLALVLALSLFLLIFVGIGEARRTYPRFEIEKMAAQGELIQMAMSPFLLTDLPLHQFPGFSTLTQPVLDSTPSINTICATNLRGEIAFSNSSSSPNNTSEFLSDFQESSFQKESDRFTVTENKEFYRVSFELEGRLERVGQLHILMPKAIVEDTINQKFIYVKIAAGILFGLYICFLALTSKKWLGDEDRTWEKGGGRLLGISYGISFFLIASLEIFMLLNIYVNGIEAKTRSLADSLGYRLDAAFSLGLGIDDFQGIDSVFDNYQNLNPDLSFVALTTTDNKIIIHTDDQLLGTVWVSQADHIEYNIPLKQGSLISEEEISLHLGIPKKIVYNRLRRAARSFISLFIASAFLTSVFFSLIRSLGNKPKLTPGTLHKNRTFLINLIGPLYFLSIFVTQGLSIAFLPQYFTEIAVEAGFAVDISSLFSVYFIAYAVALPVTGSLIEKKGIKSFLISGSLLIVFALLLLSFTRVFYLLFAIQGILGFGEGMLFIAVQSYILNVASKKDRTKGAAIIINNLYRGLLSGTAIGALLVTDPAFGQRGVFILGSIIAIFTLLYVIYLIPKISKEDFSEEKVDDPSQLLLEAPLKTDTNARKKLFSVRRDFEFIAIALLIGIPVKIIWAGIFKASLPLILDRYHYPTEDVGQIMMLYAGGVLVSSAFISRIVAKTGKTGVVLVIGTVGSGIGLVLIGLIGWDAIAQSGAIHITTITLILGMSILGLAHGFIQAPIITHVSNTRTAQELGKSSALSLYRFFERVGNIGGPLLVGALLLKSDYNALTITWIGIAVIIFGLVFFAGFKKR